MLGWPYPDLLAGITCLRPGWGQTEYRRAITQRPVGDRRPRATVAGHGREESTDLCKRAARASH
eukprot:3495-Chlamydomonas_euryale.AAC.1